ncbi:MAG: hypothetical protein JWO67_4581 [Streptosporangiaceae bacterium]|nr:hypothetical protein [Streptosporangiaceae bacterium]
MTEHRTSRQTGLGRVAAALAGASLALVTAVGTASAATGSGNGHPDFAGQARSAGLTGSQAKALQARVGAYRATMGGTQEAINKIRLGDSGVVLLALPGEKRARDLNASGGVQAASYACNYHHFCAYQHSGFTGDIIDSTACADTALNNGWSSGGSWINNQTTGTKARMKNNQFKVIYTTPGAYSSDSNGNWGPVAYIRPC